MKKTKRVVITGVGIVTSNGIGKDQFWKSLKNGTSGIKKVSLFDTAELKTHTAGEISDFNPVPYLGEKGLRTLDRTTKIVTVASKLAIDDAKLTINEANTDQIGVVLGTTLGSVYSISEFDKTALTEGPRSVNPALFPNTVINAPASQISIRFVIKGFNTTISTGFTASLDALRYACDFIKLGRANAVVVGGVEELCIQTYLGFYKLQFLAASRNSNSLELSCPFDRRRNGIVFGEGAAMLVIEDLESAQNRGATIYAEIVSFGSYFDPFRINKYNRLGPGIRQAMRLALQNAQMEPRNIDYICANANSTQEADLIEAEAIKDVFGKDASKVPVSSIKSMVGESFSAGGALALAASVGVMEKGFLPPTINYQDSDCAEGLDVVANKAREAQLKNILINTFGPSGTNTCCVIRKYKESQKAQVKTTSKKAKVTENKSKIYNLKERASNFSLSLIKFLQELEKDYIFQTLGRQLLRSGTSVGANLIEAQAAPSRKDFANFYNIALKSANETKYWLFLLKKSSQNHNIIIEQLENEIGELANIIAKSLLTMRGK